MLATEEVTIWPTSFLGHVFWLGQETILGF